MCLVAKGFGRAGILPASDSIDPPPTCGSKGGKGVGAIDRTRGSIDHHLHDHSHVVVQSAVEGEGARLGERHLKNGTEWEAHSQ